MYAYAREEWSGGERQKEERKTNEDSEEGRIVKKEERKIKKRQTSKKMKSIQELMTDLGSTQQRKAIKQGEKTTKEERKRCFQVNEAEKWK